VRWTETLAALEAAGAGRFEPARARSDCLARRTLPEAEAVARCLMEF
jgi:hypothetical protein